MGIMGNDDDLLDDDLGQLSKECKYIYSRYIERYVNLTKVGMNKASLIISRCVFIGIQLFLIYTVWYWLKDLFFN